jgi:ATP-dependent DNA ligase
VEYREITLEEAKNKVKNHFGVLGIEGLILKHPKHTQIIWKRSNKAIKIKKLLTADLKVVKN